MQENNLIIYKNSDGNIIVDAIYKDETLWLSQKGMSKVFEVGVPAISKHLKNIFEENELDKNSVVSKMEITADDGKNYNTEVYSLDAIIAVGYRINSKKATEFRIWATKILKEYMTKGFALNDERFIRGNKYDAKYFDELLERIKTIRVSERMSYQKITDLFIATSTDYNPKSEEAYTFFKIVQNKLHYAISGHTAAELIYSRANSEKEHMGLTNWKNSPDGLIYKYDVTIAKNYLNEEELNKLNDLTNMFLVFAEDEAKERHIMTMKDWINATDDLLKFRRKEVLQNSGNISHKQAVEKAESEYEKYRVIQDQEYISSMDKFYNKYLEENKKDRYIIEYNKHTQKDFEEVWNIESQYLEPSTISSVSQVMGWDRKNNDIHIFVRDKEKEKIVGEITLIPLSEKQFNDFLQNKFEDTELSAQKLSKYENDNSYYLLFSAIAIDKEYRLDKYVLHYLLEGLYTKISSLLNRNIKFQNMCAEGQTKDGQKFIENFLNLKVKNITKEGYKLYSFDNLEEMNKWINIFPKYMEKYNSTLR